MAQNFLSCDREQAMLLPASVAEWLPQGHLARFVVEVVERLDLSAFYGAYRVDGSGRPAHDPAMMVALVLYNYVVGVRSSRAIERRCVEDVWCRSVAANRTPDHVTSTASAAVIRTRCRPCLATCLLGRLPQPPPRRWRQRRESGGGLHPAERVGDAGRR
jgi:hypothetical protein